jgi:hypothetical protein
LSKKTIQEIKKDSYYKGEFRQSIFDEKLLDHINKTRNEIVQQVATDSKKINDLIFKK